MKTDWRMGSAVAVTVICATLWLFWPCTRNDQVKWDDDVYLAHAAKHQPLSWESVGWAFTAMVPFYYHPVTWLTHLADYSRHGKQLAGHHAVNVALHSLNAGLMVALTWLALSAAGRFSPGERWAAAGLAGLIFGVHPLQVESVAWLAERKNVLCGFFCLLTLVAYFNFAKHRLHSLCGWIGIVTLFTLALLSKPMAVPLPAIMLVLDWYPLRRVEQVGWRRLLVEKISFFVLSGLLATLTIIGQTQWGAVSSLTTHSIGERLLVASRAILFYLWKLIWPSWLSPYYPLGGDIRITEPDLWVPVVFLVVAVAAIFFFRRPAITAASVCYAFMVAPTSGLIQVGSQAVADRFAYLAVVPMIILAGVAGTLAWRRSPLRGRVLIASLGLVLIIFYAQRTHAMIPIWRSEEAMWEHVLHHYPRSGIANFHYAMALIDQRRIVEALPHAAHAAQMIPENALARSAAGLLYLKTKQYPEAVTELEAAIRQDPTLWAARYNLAGAYANLHRPAEALRTLRDVLTQQPSYAKLAARDPEFRTLREDPVSQQEFTALLDSVTNSPAVKAP